MANRGVLPCTNLQSLDRSLGALLITVRGASTWSRSCDRMLMPQAHLSAASCGDPPPPPLLASVCSSSILRFMRRFSASASSRPLSAAQSSFFRLQLHRHAAFREAVAIYLVLPPFLPALTPCWLLRVHTRKFITIARPKNRLVPRRQRRESK